MNSSTSHAAAVRNDAVIPIMASSKTAVMEGKPTLRQVFDAEESALLRFAYGLTGQREVAEDVVQDSFLRLHKHWNEVDQPRPWLFRCVRNLALNHLRDNRHTTSVDTNSKKSQEWEAPEPDIEAILGKLEAIGTLQLLISELPEPDRTLVSLKYLSGLRYEEIADRTQLTVSNVGYKLHHTLKSLAASLRHLGIESAEG